MSSQTPSRLAFTQASDALATLTSPSAQFATADFDPALKDWSFVKPLVVGAGGIGCELLHLLALSGFAHLTVIDMDLIELSNLNRQFLFTHSDIGKAKSTTAAAAVQARCPGVSVTAVVGCLEDQPDDFYRSFDAVLLAVDSIPARRWINRKVAEIAKRVVVPTPASASPPAARSTAPPEDAVAASTAQAPAVVYRVGDYVMEDAKLIIDTGTEGFEGHCRVIHMAHNRTPCIECEMYLYNDGATRATVPLCTLESVPRAPEHCVLYVQLKEWPEHHRHRRRRRSQGDDGDGAVAGGGCEEDSKDGDRDEPLDPDNAEHVRWVAERARARQAAFGIGGAPIDDLFTVGVIKNVVPAVGFTNAYVAGQAVTELMKWLTGCAPELNNYAFYNGATETGVYTNVEPCRGAPMHGSGDVAGRCLVCEPRPVVAVDASAVSAVAFRDGLIELLAPDATAAAMLRRGIVLLVFQSASRLVEVPLPNAVKEAGAVKHENIASMLCAAGHEEFVKQWKDGARMATVECFGAADNARVSALVQWRGPPV
ncbi:UBA3 / ubiquitin activating enzyme [Leishmania donovani]|uniref:NEDD8-activating enzyme E1 catalytic subunit n=1 Tax=Leishmania donovani TaxID=5661 RepID=A0A504XN32_LEIDO|nr:ThiF family protein [Leishmania donovani]CAJ1985658.1 UBA3 / ubiquitin activating enzyme [Leishmania donovani]VDZ41563.1 ubiquitin_activating_enzyme_putative/GeneDB:LmjF.01.0710 [Leishmania donovani]